MGGIEKGRVNDASLREQFSRFGPIDGKNIKKSTVDTKIFSFQKYACLKTKDMVF